MDGGIRLQWPSGMKHTATRDRWFERFSKLPPGLNLQQIASDLNEPYASVYRWADLFQYPFPDLRREGRVASGAWDDIDWKQRDAEIARVLDISRERVRQVRAARGIGPSAHRATVQKFNRWVGANCERLHGMPVFEVLSQFGGDLSQQVARRLLRTAGVRPHDPASRWQGIDWHLPNRDLARVWTTSAKYIANIRARLQVGPAKWDAKSPRIESDAEYQERLAQEQLKSRSAKKQQKGKRNRIVRESITAM
jgi:hypothetical protein